MHCTFGQTAIAHNLQALTAYAALFDFSSMQFVDAVRGFLTPFRLPGEAQKIDRIMCTFAHR